MNAAKLRSSAHSEFSLEHNKDPKTLPCFAPRIAFRDSTNRTNRRTVIACLVPLEVFIAHQGNYFLWPRGNEKDQAFLLGVLSSIPLDLVCEKVCGGPCQLLYSKPIPDTAP